MWLYVATKGQFYFKCVTVIVIEITVVVYDIQMTVHHDIFLY
jgi:hypothetical protein